MAVHELDSLVKLSQQFWGIVPPELALRHHEDFPDEGGGVLDALVKKKKKKYKS